MACAYALDVSCEIMKTPRNRILTIGTVVLWAMTCQVVRSAEEDGAGRAETKQEQDGYVGMVVHYVELDWRHIIIPQVAEDGPAAQAGIKRGDILLAVDDTVLVGDEPLAAVVKMVRGPIGTRVRLTVKREGAEAPIQVTVVRGEKPTAHVGPVSTDK
jgi:carboxyl-terminal processing protease